MAMASAKIRTDLDDRDLDRFREVQQLAYRCVQEVGAALRPGITERQAAGRLRRALIDGGVQDWFHIPFAWFGERTTLEGFGNPLKFFPSNRRIEEGMPYILDVAPIVDGYTSDIGYAGCLGDNPLHDRMMTDLAEYRPLILDLVRERRPLSEIYAEVDALAAKQGYQPAHHTYPGRVLAHQVWRVRSRGPKTVVAGFGNRSLRTLARSIGVGFQEGWSPLWAGGHRSDHPPVKGLWAIEPHLGFHGVGVKFEELLVVTDDDAFWLDDDLPHVRRWRSAA
jgi:Xaa-Pro aminopeptidase